MVFKLGLEILKINEGTNLIESKKPVLIFCKIIDISMDESGNIYLIFSKNKKETLMESARKLREFIGKDCSIIVSDMR